MFELCVAALHMHATALAHSKGCRDRCRGKMMGRENDRQGFGEGEFVRDTWVTYCQWILNERVRQERGVGRMRTVQFSWKDFEDEGNFTFSPIPTENTWCLAEAHRREPVHYPRITRRSALSIKNINLVVCKLSNFLRS
jgi:hypothetical protein